MTDGPDYRRLMDLILSRIASGEYSTGSKIPSTANGKATAGHATRCGPP